MAKKKAKKRSYLRRKPRKGSVWVKASKGRVGYWRRKPRKRSLRGLKGCTPTVTTSKGDGVLVGLGKTKRKRRKRRTLKGLSRSKGSNIPIKDYKPIQRLNSVSGLGKTKRKKRKSTAKRRK